MGALGMDERMSESRQHSEHTSAHHIDVEVENFNAFLQAVQAASSELDDELSLGADSWHAGNVLLGFVQHVANGLNDGHEERPERNRA